VVGIDALADLLDDRGVKEVAEDSEQPGEVKSAAGDWEWAEEDCGYASGMVAGWGTDVIDGGRHQWLLSQATRLAAAHRRGCLTKDGHTEAASALAKAFRAALATGSQRGEGPVELAAAFSLGVQKVECKTDEKVDAELGGHVHLEPVAPFLRLVGEVGSKDWAFCVGEQAGEVVTLAEKVAAGVAVEKDFWASRPNLTRVHDYARSRRVSPWAVLLSVLLNINAAIEPNVVLPGLGQKWGSLNTLVALVGRSGQGKGEAEGAAQDAVIIRGMFGDIETYRTGLGSGEGIGHTYCKKKAPIGKPTDGIPVKTEYESVRTRAIFSVAEVDKMFALGLRAGSTLSSTVREVAEAANIGQAYVDEAKRLPVEAHTYRACISLGVQPKRAQRFMDEAAGGTPQRFVWASCIDPDMPDVRPADVEPLKLELPAFPLIDGWHVLHVCQTARDVVDAERVIIGRGGGEDLDAHARFVQLKVAAAVGVLCGHAGITEEDWATAEAIMVHSVSVRDSVITKLASEKAIANAGAGKAAAEREIVTDDLKAERAIKRVLKWAIGKLQSTDEWVPEVELRRAVASRDRGWLPEALERAVAAGLAECKPGEGAGRFGQVYRRGVSGTEAIAG
jgi:hypothetical protein